MYRFIKKGLEISQYTAIREYYENRYMHAELTIDWNGKKKKEFKEILSQKEEGNSLLTEKTIEDPNAVLKALGLNTNFLDNEPFSNLRTNSDIWEFYLIKMFKIKEDEYKYWIKDFSDKSPAYRHCSRRRVGNSWNQYNDNDVKYPTIDSNDLIKASEKFVGRLQQFKGPLRKVDKKNITNRKKAAKAFNSYLLKSMKFGKKAINDIFFDNKNEDFILMELLKRSYWNKNPGLDSNHMLAICLMLCLYGHQKQGYISQQMAKIVCQKLNLLKNCDNEIREKIIRNLEDRTSYFKKPFIPPYKYVYTKYRDRINIFFRIKTWIRLVKTTYLAGV